MARQRQLPHDGGRRPAGAAATMMLMLLLAMTTTLFSGTALAQTTDGDNQILYPNSTDLTVHYLDTVVISYETDYTSPWMYLFCEKNNQLQEIAYYSPSDIAGSTLFPFELSFDYMDSTPCWFNLRSAKRDSSDNGTDVGASSPTFTYNANEGDHETFAIDPNSIPTTISTKPSSTATTAIATADPTNATSDSSSNSNSDSDDSDDGGGGLSAGVKAGIAIGVVALVGLAAVTAWLLFDRRRSKKPSPIVCELDGGGPDIGGAGSMSPTGTMKQSVMTMPVSPPSAIDHSHNNHHHYYNNSINNNNLLSPYSGAGGTIDSDLPPPPPPPAAEKPQSLSLSTRQFHELPENTQRFELDGGDGGGGGGDGGVDKTPASAYTHPSMHSPIIGSLTPESLHSPTIQHSPKVLLPRM